MQLIMKMIFIFSLFFIAAISFMVGGKIEFILIKLIVSIFILSSICKLGLIVISQARDEDEKDKKKNIANLTAENKISNKLKAKA